MTNSSFSDTPLPSRHSRGSLYFWVALLLLFTAVFLGLGIWQVERLHWKLDLIARVDARVHAEPQAAPGPAAWSGVNAADDEYRHVKVSGEFLNDAESQVYASTNLGPGYWVLTPLKAADGSLTMINRGFVPIEKRDPKTRPEGQAAAPVAVTGLLRMNEPKGTLLRSNAPAEGRWYSRDVTAMAAAHDLGSVAPYFIDADKTANPGGLPVGGETQIVFPNSHLQYALTWFAMALMSAGMAIYLVVADRRRTAAQGPSRKVVDNR